VQLDNPSSLLDLKSQEDRKNRLFPAEQLVEDWILLAKEKGVNSSKRKGIVDAVRSFYKHNRVPLIEVKAPYKPKPKEALSDEDLRQFREALSFYGKILFDFLLSVPLREGQFQQCKHCGESFYPRWRHITTYPRIEAYSPFIIWPQKGHENENYHASLRQVCFLTETVAKELNMYRNIKEKALGRKLEPQEYIFTHQKNIEGIAHITPIAKEMVVSTFWRAYELTGIKISPHTPRSWINSILASRGIDKQLRDLYLGHSCAYEEGYIMQLIPQWQHTFKQTRAMEHLDIMGNVLSAFDVESMQLQIEEQRQKIQHLTERLNATNIAPGDFETVKTLIENIKTGKIKIVLTKKE